MADFIKEILQERNQLREDNSKLEHILVELQVEIDQLKQALERIKDIVTQINFTVAGGDESPKHEWIRLYRTIVYEVSKIINEVK